MLPENIFPCQKSLYRQSPKHGFECIGGNVPFTPTDSAIANIVTGTSRFQMGSNPGHSLMLVSISSNLHRLLDRVPWCLGPWCGGISPPTYRPELIKNDEQGYMRSKVGSIVQNACEDIGEYGQWCKWIKRDPHSTGTGCASGAGRLTLVNMFINSVRDKVVHT